MQEKLLEKSMSRNLRRAWGQVSSRTRALLPLLIAGVSLSMSLSACEDTVIDPFQNDDRFFTVYGFLDSRESEHSIRVIPITRFVEQFTAGSEAQASIDATVTSTDLATGVVTRWVHKLSRLMSGELGHVFTAKFFVRPGRTYRLEILRSDGTITSAETTVPRFPITIPTPDTLFFPFEVSPDTGLRQEVVVPDIASPWDMIVTYDLQGTNVRLPYGRPGHRTDDGGWSFSIDMGADAPRMRDFLGLDASDPLPLLHAITLQIRALDSNWDPPEGVFDPEVLAQPGTLSNVDKGFGLWGSIGLYQYTWIAPPGSGQ